MKDNIIIGTIIIIGATLVIGIFSYSTWAYMSGFDEMICKERVGKIQDIDKWKIEYKDCEQWARGSR